ncbi:MAG: glycosyltransferase family A protein [Rhodocyclaceae bacterium]|nr:glycosyltransferase family A protein [Rhodocyclaceae bacterium]MDZ4216487.1 glycosyltransferase family A protein [Rhodocyclaceae bacterium]
MNTPARPLVSVVIIGRNEGERLSRCLASVAAMDHAEIDIETLYVDSASTDDSVARATVAGARVIEVRPERPSAALGRNAGWQAARGEFVLFLDGDTILHPQFVNRALQAMRNPQVAVVWGHRRELHPEHSIYNRVLDLDWIYPAGESEFCGGDALMRRSVLEAVGGFDASLIAGEEPEMCRRIRVHGFGIQHIDAPMTGHDLAITRFAAYWKRAYRAGHAYAEIAARFRHSPDPMWLKDSRRNLMHAGILTGCLALLPVSLVWPVVAVLVAAFLGLLVARTFRRCQWKSPDPATRLLYSIHSHLQQIPIALGQLSYLINTHRGRNSRLIEYKGTNSVA